MTDILPTKGDIFPDTDLGSAPDFVFGAVLFIDGTLGQWKFAIGDKFAVANGVEDLWRAYPNALKAWLGEALVENPLPLPVPTPETF